MAMANIPRQDHTGLKMGGFIMKQPAFNWNTKDKYEELQNCKLEVSNVLQSNNLGQTKKVFIIQNWLGTEGLQLMATLTQDKNEACNNEKGLFDMV